MQRKAAPFRTNNRPLHHAKDGRWGLRTGPCLQLRQCVTSARFTSCTLTERLAYDPWGKRRFINSTPGMPDKLETIVGQKTDRGFTMHEHLDEIGIVHMNGRVYDPLIGRFMSADPHLTYPNDLQSYNRYAYVMNNPLFYTDPSGFDAWSDFRDGVLKPAIIIGVGIYTGALISNGLIVGAANGFVATGFTSTTFAAIGFEAGSLTIWGGALAGAGGGFAVGLLSSGTLAGGVQGAVSGALFGAAGGVGLDSSPERYLAHAAAGCVSAAAGGGNCGTGAAAAVFGKYTTNNIDIRDVVMRGIATAVAGGVGSTIAGGKFENGAVTAAYGYLFNCVINKCYLLSPGAGSSIQLKDSNSNGYYGQQATLDALRRIDYAWQAAGELQDILITEISQEVGPTKGHDSHQEGKNVDIRPMRTSGDGELTYRSPSYDRAATQRLVNTILNVSPGARILFNDPNIKGVSPYKKHDDHLHVTFP